MSSDIPSEILLGPFSSWKTAIQLDNAQKLEESASEFSKSAGHFYQVSEIFNNLRRPLFEYSTLMDAFAAIQRSRNLRMKEDYDASLSNLARANEIFRATVHFGFLSPFISASSSVEVADEMEICEDRFQGYKNAIALFEQSKIALSFRDDAHPVLKLIDARIKLAMSEALQTEAEISVIAGDHAEARKREQQSKILMKEYESIKKQIRLANRGYFPIEDFLRAEDGAFVMSYPDAMKITLINLGTNAAEIDKLGNLNLKIEISPFGSYDVSLSQLSKGRIRVSYRDESTGQLFDEGCLILI